MARGLFQHKRHYEKLMKPTKAPVLYVDTVRARRWFKTFYQRMQDVETQNILKKLVFDFLKEVIPRTPVDTGRARGAWTVFYDMEGRLTGPDLADTSRVAQIGGAAGPPQLKQSAIYEGKSMGKVLQYLGKSPLQYILVTNAVPYIVKLEFTSHSKQSTGFVRLSIEKVRISIAKSANQAIRSAAITAHTHMGRVAI